MAGRLLRKLARFFSGLTSEETDRRADKIRAWASSVPGVTMIADAQPRSVACIAGVVEGMRVRPREGVPVIEATVADGTGAVTAVWLGRRSIPGLTLGARLILTGRLGGTAPALQMMNPSYEFAPSPDAH